MSVRSCRLVYHGIAFFEVHVDGGPTIIIDPCIALNPFTTVRLEDLPKPDAVLVSHGARDHVGEMLEIVKGANCRLIAPRNVKAHAAKKGVPASQMETMVAGVRKEVGNVSVKALETRHGSYYISDGETLSDVSLSYILTLPSGLKLYHMGDGALSADMKMFGEVYAPDVLLIPIGRFRGASCELEPEEAALATKWLGAKVAIPMHYDLRDEADAPEKFSASIKQLGLDVRVINLQPGESLDL